MRNDFFDFAKGILILLVILGHAIQYCAVDEYVWLNPIFNIIYTFHMPLFMNNIFIFKDISAINVICAFFMYYIFSLLYTYGIKSKWFNKLFLGRY